MSKKTLWLIVAVLLLGGLSLYLNRDRFQSDSIQIGHRTLPNRDRRGRNTPATSLVFLSTANSNSLPSKSSPSATSPPTNIPILSGN